MKLTKNILKILLGILVFAPAASMLIEFLVILPIINRINAHPASDFAQQLLNDKEYRRWERPLAVLSLVYFCLMIAFIIMAFRNQTMSKGIRFVWALGIFFAGFAMIPSYYFLFIIRKPEVRQVVLDKSDV
ncbi:MAG: hypothetical protein ACYC6Z_09545 [Thermoleophilia bacterium]